MKYFLFKIRILFFISLGFTIFGTVTPKNCYAAGAIDAQRRAQQERQAEQQALQKQAYQEAVRQQMMQKELVTQHRQQQIDAYERKLSQKQKIMYQEAVKREIAQQRLASGSVPSGLQETNGILVSAGGRKIGNPDEIIDIYDLWEEFEHSSEAWSMMMDDQPKRLTVQKYIDYFQKKGIYIRKPADHYVQMLNGMAKGNPQMMAQPFERVMQFIAIMEYDFDNGSDRDALAQRVLGEQFYQQNRKRLGR